MRSSKIAALCGVALICLEATNSRPLVAQDDQNLERNAKQQLIEQAKIAQQRAQQAEQEAVRALERQAKNEQTLRQSLAEQQKDFSKSLSVLEKKLRELQMDITEKNAVNDALKAQLDAVRASLSASQASRSQAIAEYSALTANADAEPPKYWIGIQCVPLSKELHAFLDVDIDEGTVVNATLAESPAMKAGLQQFDVIIGANDKRVGSVIELTEVIDEAKEKPVKLRVIRKGEELSVKVTPEPRPNENVAADAWRRSWTDSWIPSERILWGEHLEKAKKNGAISLNVMPPQVAQAFAFRIGDVPENFRLDISKTGKQPMRIKVTRGDESWDVKENELHKLPKDVRALVTRAFGPTRLMTGPSALKMVPQMPRFEYRLTRPNSPQATGRQKAGVDGAHDQGAAGHDHDDHVHDHDGGHIHDDAHADHIHDNHADEHAHDDHSHDDHAHTHEPTSDVNELANRLKEMEKIMKQQASDLEKQVDALRKRIERLNNK